MIRCMNSESTATHRAWRGVTSRIRCMNLEAPGGVTSRSLLYARLVARTAYIVYVYIYVTMYIYVTITR